jgi:hypothetical protein
MKTKEQRKEEAWEEYKKMREPALEEYEKMRKKAWQKYKKKCLEIDGEVCEVCGK